ncbi:MAG: ATP-binding protein [Bacteroidota bacterium]
MDGNESTDIRTFIPMESEGARAELIRRYNELQLKVTRFSAIEQELINTRNSLDNEIVIHKRMHAFNRNALKEISDGAFLKLIAEAIVDIFEVETGLAFFGNFDEPASILFGIEGASVAEHEYLKIKSVLVSLYRILGQGKILQPLPAEMQLLGPDFPLSEAYITLLDEPKNGISLMIVGGNLVTNNVIYEKLEEERNIIFDVFGQQVLAQAVNRKKNREILEARESVRKLNEELEQRVIKRTEQLELANKELESFSYSIAHDLRTPLRHISSFAQLITSEHANNIPEEAQHFLDTIVRNTNLMSSLMDRLLEFTKNSTQPLVTTQIEIKKIVETARMHVESIAGDVTVEWRIADLPVIKADNALLHFVWINLLDNAYKFSKGRNPAIIEVNFYETIDDVVFYVRDNGVGFDMKYSQKLFGVFQRLHSSVEFDGTGIGLANVRKIITRHGGKVWADSELDKGSTFYFSIPK